MASSSRQRLLEALGEVLRARREHAGLSQEELNFQTGVHRTYISELERGIANPTIVTLERLAQALGTKPSTLLRDMERELDS